MYFTKKKGRTYLKINSMVRNLLIALLVLSALMINAQDSPYKYLQLGVEGGITNTTIEGPIVDHYEKQGGGDFSRRKGFNSSIFLRWSFAKHFYSEFALGYYQKGGWYRNSPYVNDIIMPVNYLNIPLVIGVRGITAKWVKVSGEAGIAYDILIDCKDEGCLNLDKTFSYPAPDTEGSYGTTFEIKNPISVVYGLRIEVRITEDMSVSGKLRAYDDLNYFFGNQEDFSISGKGYSFEFGVMYKIVKNTGSNWSKPQGN
jgi:hypothetical protein